MKSLLSERSGAMSVAKRRKILLMTTIILIAICSLVLAMTLPVSADGDPSGGGKNLPGVEGYSTWGYGTNARGVYGWTNTMRNPALVGLHVCSLYVYQDPVGYNMVELGHYRQVGWPAARYFWAIQIAGPKHYWSGYTAGFNSPDGTDHYYHLYRDHSVGGGQYQWYFLVDNVHRWSLNTQLYTGYAIGSSERAYGNDSNWAHFWNLKKLTEGGTWYDWVGGAKYRDTDPGYHYHKISDTQFTVITPN